MISNFTKAKMNINKVKTNKTVLSICVVFVIILTAYFFLIEKIIIGLRVEKDLDIIMQPSIYSNTEMFIREHKEEYDDIISMGDKALDYMLMQFKWKNEDGYKGHIMAQACMDILGEEYFVKSYMTGEEWYSKYLEFRKK